MNLGVEVQDQDGVSITFSRDLFPQLVGGSFLTVLSHMCLRLLSCMCFPGISVCPNLFFFKYTSEIDLEAVIVNFMCHVGCAGAQIFDQIFFLDVSMRMLLDKAYI